MCMMHISFFCICILRMPEWNSKKIAGGMKMNAWEMPQVQALGEERLRLMQEAAEKCRGKSGMERLDIFLEYGEKLSEGGPLAPEEQKALLAAVAASLPEQEQKQLTQLMQMMGI